MPDGLGDFAALVFAVLLSSDLLLGEKTKSLAKSPPTRGAYETIFWCSLVGFLLFPLSTAVGVLRSSDLIEQLVLIVMTVLSLVIASCLVIIKKAQTRRIGEREGMERIADEIRESDLGRDDKVQRVLEYHEKK